MQDKQAKAHFARENNLGSPLHQRGPSGRRKFIFMLLIPLVVSGCGNSTDLKSIQTFAALSNEATNKFPRIVSDFYGSCARAARFRPLQERELAKEKCASTYRQEFENEVNVTHKVLMNYLLGLAALAADDTVNFDPELNKLAKTFEEVGAPAPQVKAVNGIVKFLFTAATEQYRREKLKQAIQSTDSDMQILIDGLETIVARNYSDVQLGLEDASMTKFYTLSVAKHEKQEPLTALLVDRQWKEEEASLEQRKVAASTYVKMLEQIAQGHRELKGLYDTGEDVGSKQIAQTTLKYAKTLAVLLEDLRKAF